MNSTIVSRLEVTQIFCEVDDFYQTFERHWQQQALLTASCGERLYRSGLSVSEVMTIVIAFDGSGYRTFKDFYTQQVLPGWRKAFPNQVSYKWMTINNYTAFNGGYLLKPLGFF